MSRTTTLLGVAVIVVAAVVLAPIVLMLFAWPMMGMWGGGHMWDSGPWNGGMWNGGLWGMGPAWPWFLLWIVFLFVVLGVVYLLFRAMRTTGGDGTDVAIEELRMAYARGDLSEGEFESRLDRLREES
ncbi:MAG: SHOCT domain-containing protein [Halobacteriota archaeon]